MKKLVNNEAAFGVWINSTDPLLAEIAVTYGAEWLFIDAEHEPIDRSHLTAILMACKGSSCQPLVRLPENQNTWFKWALDLGAAGVIVPQAKSIDDVTKAVDFAKYRPLGRRGVGPMRAAKFFADRVY